MIWHCQGDEIMVDYYKGSFGFDDLQDILIRLRQPDGCPWDAAQTHTTIRKDFLEEVYQKTTFRRWFCGHYHYPQDIDDNFQVLYWDIEEL